MCALARRDPRCALAGRDVAIVTPEAGTTRDLVEAHLDIGGYAVTFVDTAGMRKAEIDSAEWRMVDFADNVIHVEETEVLHLKTDDSDGKITVDPEAMAELRALMPAPLPKSARNGKRNGMITDGASLGGGLV